MSEQIDTSASRVVQAAFAMNVLGYHETSALLLALRDERDAERARAESAKAERNAFRDLADLQNKVSDALRQRAENAEAQIASGSFYKERDIDALQDRASLVSTPAARDVLAERRRQIEAEGWTAEHDDRHIQGELAAAAVCYIVPSADRLDTYRLFWPPTWDKQWWKPAGPPDDPTARRRDLVRGVAMGLAEIERLDRLAGRRHAAGDTRVSRVRIVTTPTSMSLHYAWRAYSPERPDLGWTYGATEEDARERFRDELRQDERDAP